MNETLFFSGFLLPRLHESSVGRPERPAEVSFQTLPEAGSTALPVASPYEKTRNQVITIEHIMKKSFPCEGAREENNAVPCSA